MRKLLLLFLFLISSFHVFSAQNKLLNENEIKRQYDQLAQQEASDENFKAVQQLYIASQKINYEQGIARGAYTLANYYIYKNDYQKALSLNEIAEKLAEKHKDGEALFAVHNNKSRIYAAQGFETECLKENHLSIKSALQIKDHNLRHYTASIAYVNIAANLDNFKRPQDSMLLYLKKSLNEAEQISDAKEWHMKKYDMIIFMHSNLGDFYTSVHKPSRLELAEPYYMKALEYKKTHPEVFKRSDILVLNLIGIFYAKKENYKKAIEFAQEVLELEKNKKNPQQRKMAYMTLSDSYKKLENTGLQAKYTSLYAELNDSINTVNKKSVDKSSQQIVSAEKNKYSQSTRNIIWSAAGIVLLITIVSYIFWRKNNKKLHKKYEDLIQKLNSEKEKSPINTFSEIKKNSSFNIPDETVSLLLTKLEKFESSDKYLKKGTDLSSLSHQLNTNPKYLSEVIKQHKGKSFNSYINGLKIDYITRKLYEDPQYRLYKISHLAELCGFSSRDVFASTFKKETGVSPSYIISQLNNEKNEMKA